MTLLKKVGFPIVVALTMSFYSCGPNDDKGSMDVKNSNGEGAIDSTRLTNFDSAGVTNGSDSTVKK
jgi:hypothetical protein